MRPPEGDRSIVQEGSSTWSLLLGDMVNRILNELVMTPYYYLPPRHNDFRWVG